MKLATHTNFPFMRAYYRLIAQVEGPLHEGWDNDPHTEFSGASWEREFRDADALIYNEGRRLAKFHGEDPSQVERLIYNCRMAADEVCFNNCGHF